MAKTQSGKGRPVITLLTDFGERDVFAGVMKGVIAKINPEANVIDLSHGVTPFDAAEAALMLCDAYPYFPADTIHVVVVDPGVGGARRILAAVAEGHLFVAPDTGILHPILSRDHAALVVAATNAKYHLPDVSRTFHGRDIFAPVAAHLSLGVDLGALGPRVTDPVALDLPEATRARGNEIAGEVTRVDRFGNLITNVCAAALGPPSGWDAVRVAIGGKTIRGLSRAYSDAPAGALVALVGSFGTLEVGRNRGSARDLLGLDRSAPVKVKLGGAR